MLLLTQKRQEYPVNTVQYTYMSQASQGTTIAQQPIATTSFFPSHVFLLSLRLIASLGIFIYIYTYKYISEREIRQTAYPGAVTWHIVAIYCDSE